MLNFQIIRVRSGAGDFLLFCVAVRIEVVLRWGGFVSHVSGR